MKRWSGGAVMGAVMAVVLAACQVGSGFGVVRSAPVLDGALNVGVPAGYCIDRAASREKNGTAVVIMGRCNAGVTQVPAVATVTVGGPASGGVLAAGTAALAGWFASPAGRATLSRRGRASDIRLNTVLAVEGALLLHATDRTAGEYWRAVTAVKGRLVTISAIGSPGVALPEGQGRRLIDQLLAAQRQANAAG